MAFINNRPTFRAATEVVTATNTLTATESGKILFLNSTTEFDTVLPAPEAGLHFTFIVAAAPSGASYTITTNGTTQNIIYGCSVSSNDAGGNGAQTNATAVDVITFVDGQAKVGDYLWMVSDGTYWYAYAVVQDEDAVTFA